METLEEKIEVLEGKREEDEMEVRMDEMEEKIEMMEDKMETMEHKIEDLEGKDERPVRVGEGSAPLVEWTVGNGEAPEADHNCNNKCIIMHSRDIDIHEDTIQITQDGKMLEVEGIGYDKERDFLIIYTPNVLKPGAITIKMNFVSQLNDNLHGFYRSQYFDNLSNTTKTIGTTQFEVEHARKAFPCFDEPDFKATFTIGLGRTKNMITLSNMEKTDVVGIDDEYVMDLYAESVKMSTYLLAFIVCEFGSTHAQGHETFKVWGPEKRIPELAYAAEIGPKIITFFEELFDYKFPLEKMDMAAIPDFSAGAMENWGLITYRDTAVLYDNVSYALKNKQRVATVVSHELAHMWFGNLVTMKWWDDLWLNEGFASYVEYLGVDHVNPEMKIMDQFLYADFHDVLYLDSLPSSHPISTNIENPGYQGNFDRISYAKGACLIRMMNNFMTKEVFQKGIANYFKIHKYANAEQDDLWAALGKQAHKEGVLDPEVTVKSIMDTWTLQKGYPVLHIKLKDGNWELKQEKFNLEFGLTEKEEYRWTIPVSFKSINEDLTDMSVSYWLNDTAATITAPEDAQDTPYIFNIGQMGYYRVNYSPEMWAKLLDESVFFGLSNLNRAQIYDDSLNLARAGVLPYETALQISKFLKEETDYTALKTALRGLSFIEKMLKGHQGAEEFKTYLLNILDNTYNQVSTSESTEYLEVRKRALINSWACDLDHQKCIDVAKKTFEGWLAAENFQTSVDPNSKHWVYCTGVKYGSTDDWNKVWDRLQIVTNSLERLSLISALGCTTDEKQLDIYLEKSIDPQSKIRRQDIRYVYSAVGQNGADRMMAWLVNNWDRVSEYFGENFPSNIRPIITGYPETASTQAQYDVLAKLLKERRGELKSSAEHAEQSLDKIKANIKWSQQFKSQVIGEIGNQARRA